MHTAQRLRRLFAATENGPIEGPFFIALIGEGSAYRPAWRVNDTLGFL
jgi:hypothetical protein